jgi:hypothetical protein
MAFVWICVGIYCILWSTICVIVCSNLFECFNTEIFLSEILWPKSLKMLYTVRTHPHKRKGKYPCVCTLFWVVNTHLCKWGRFLHLVTCLCNTAKFDRQVPTFWRNLASLSALKMHPVCSSEMDCSCLPNHMVSHCCRSRTTMWLRAWRLLAFRLLEESEGPQLS